MYSGLILHTDTGKYCQNLSGQARFRSGSGQVRSSLQNKFNSLELDTEVGRLVVSQNSIPINRYLSQIDTIHCFFYPGLSVCLRGAWPSSPPPSCPCAHDGPPWPGQQISCPCARDHAPSCPETCPCRDAWLSCPPHQTALRLKELL